MVHLFAKQRWQTCAHAGAAGAAAPVKPAWVSFNAAAKQGPVILLFKRSPVPCILGARALTRNAPRGLSFEQTPRRFLTEVSPACHARSTAYRGGVVRGSSAASAVQGSATSCTAKLLAAGPHHQHDANTMRLVTSCRRTQPYGPGRWVCSSGSSNSDSSCKHNRKSSLCQHVLQTEVSSCRLCMHSGLMVESLRL